MQREIEQIKPDIEMYTASRHSGGDDDDYTND